MLNKILTHKNKFTPSFFEKTIFLIVVFFVISPILISSFYEISLFFAEPVEVAIKGHNLSNINVLRVSLMGEAKMAQGPTDLSWIEGGKYFLKIKLVLPEKSIKHIEMVKVKIGTKEFEFNRDEFIKKWIKKENSIDTDILQYESPRWVNAGKLYPLINVGWSNRNLYELYKVFLKLLLLLLALFIAGTIIMKYPHMENSVFYDGQYGIFVRTIFPILLGLTSFSFTYVFSFFGFRWDEQYVAYGGYLIASGLKPYIDFGIPTGPLVFYLQSLGSLLFPLNFYGYGLSAAFINGLIVFSLALYLLRVLKLKICIALLIVAITHFSFFGTAGCLWYNQLSALWVSIAFIYVAHIVFNKNVAFSNSSIIMISFLLGLAILSKHDLGLLAYLVMPFLIFGLSIGYVKPFRRVMVFILLFLIPLTIVFLTLFYFKSLGGEPYYWINYGQSGYESRINPIKFIKHSFFLINFSDVILNVFRFGIIYILFIAIFITNFFVKISYKIPAFILLFIILIFTNAVKVTSGHGAGYIMPHLTSAAIIIFLSYLNLIPLEFKKKLSKFVLPILIIGISTIPLVMFKDFVSRYDYGSFNMIKSGPLKGYMVTLRTKIFFEDYFNAINKISDDKKLKLIAWNTGSYQFIHPNIIFKAYKGPLWIHKGITTRDTDYDNLITNFKKNLPDVIILPQDYIVTDYTFSSEGKIGRLVKENYIVLLDGYIDTIGSAGYPMKHFVYLRKTL